jgi:hypothetical protein
MPNESHAGKTPRFKVGDQVTVVSPVFQKGKQGGVVEVIEGVLDYVHRYHVRFEDGTWGRFFGFELEPITDQWSQSA